MFITLSVAMSRPGPSWGGPHGEPKRGRSANQTSLWEQIPGALPDGHGTIEFSHFQVPDGHGTTGFSYFQVPDSHGTTGHYEFFILSAVVSRPGLSWGGPPGEPKRGNSVIQTSPMRSATVGGI